MYKFAVVSFIFTYYEFIFQWEVGDFIISDNLAVGHEATPETQHSRSQVGLRVLHRTTIKGVHPPKDFKKIIF